MGNHPGLQQTSWRIRQTLVGLVRFATSQFKAVLLFLIFIALAAFCVFVVWELLFDSTTQAPQPEAAIENTGAESGLTVDDQPHAGDQASTNNGITAPQSTTEAVSVVGLLALAGIFIILAVEGKRLIPRLQKLGPQGVEFGVWEEIKRFPTMKIPPAAPDVFLTHYSVPNCAVRQPELLTHEQHWYYQLAKSLLFHLYHLGVTADQLDRNELQDFRRLVLWTGKTALSQFHTDTHMAFEILKYIEILKDLDRDEQYYLAMAYFLVAYLETTDDQEKLRRAADLLESVVKKDEEHAASHYLLGYIYDELQLYKRAIKHSRKAVDYEESEYGIFGRWVEAVSWVKLDAPQVALSALRLIPRGGCWNKIFEDSELAPLKTFGGQFAQLYKAKTT